MAGIDFTTRVREVPDFPEPGVGFKDISPLLLDPEALRQAVGQLADWTRKREADLVLGAEARGFWLGAAGTSRAGKSPNEKLNVAFIAAGGRASANIDAAPAEAFAWVARIPG